MKRDKNRHRVSKIAQNKTVIKAGPIEVTIWTHCNGKNPDVQIEVKGHDEMRVIQRNEK